MRCWLWRPALGLVEDEVIDARQDATGRNCQRQRRQRRTHGQQLAGRAQLERGRADLHGQWLGNAGLQGEQYWNQQHPQIRVA